MRAQAKRSSAANGYGIRVLLTLALSAIALLSLASHAFAVSRAYESSFGSFGNPQAVTVDQANGDLYVIDVAAGTLSRFAADGTAKNFTAGPDAGTNTLTGFFFDNPSAAQVAIDNSGSGSPGNGNIYVASLGGIGVYAPTGAQLGSLNGSGNAIGVFGEACGVAVDQSNGDVYVGDYFNHVWRYSPSANPVTESDYSGGIETSINICGVAADAGNVYAGNTYEGGPLLKFAASTFTLGTPPAPSSTQVDAVATAVATDSSSGDVYVDEGSKIAVFNSAGSALYSFGSSANFGTDSVGVAVKGSSGKAYVADRTAGQIDVFSSPIIPPTITTKPATEIRHTRAVLNGHLDPGTDPGITDCDFEWGTTVAYGNTAPCAQGNSFTTPADVSAMINGLTPGVTYHFRLSTSSTASGDVDGADQSVTATPVPGVQRFTASVGATGSGDGQFSGNTGIGVDQTSGDVYVADTGNHRIVRLDKDGDFISTWGWGVDDGTAAAQVCTASCQAGISGSAAGQLNAPRFVAVDNSGGPSAGSVYVADTATNLVQKFGPAGNLITTWGGTPAPGQLDGSTATNGPFATNAPLATIAGIAIGGSGVLNVYNTSFPGGRVFKFAEDGSFIADFKGGERVTEVFGVAVDPEGNFFKVNGDRSVEKFGPSGTDIGQVSASDPDATNVAVDSLTGDLFVTFATGVSRYHFNSNGQVVQGDGTTCDVVPLGSCEPSETFGSSELAAATSVAVNGASGRSYVSDSNTVKIFDRAITAEATTGAAIAVTNTGATLNGTASPNGVPLTDCHFEYVTDLDFRIGGFSDLASGGSSPCDPAFDAIPVDLEDHAVSGAVTGLTPGSIYRFRLVVANDDGGVSVGAPATFVTMGPPAVETTGSPIRTATTARLDSRVDPRNAPTTFHFEYGTQGPCDSNPCTSTTPLPGGSDGLIHQVSQKVSGLQADTTYHYRVIADNGNPAGSVAGEDMTLTTRASDAPLSHGRFTGSPGSDRAYEQVNLPDTGGNPVNSGVAFSDNGTRAIYFTSGGNPSSPVGGFLSEFLAERVETAPHEGGWKSIAVMPPRDELAGSNFNWPSGPSDLSSFTVANFGVAATQRNLWRLSADAPAQQLFEPVPPQEYGLWYVGSDDSTRVVAKIKGGTLDPAYPAATAQNNLYDVSNGAPKLASLLPGNVVAPCGVSGAVQASELDGETAEETRNWLSADGELLFFPSCLDLYMRELDAEQTKLISGPPLSGDQCAAGLIKSTAEAAFFWTQTRLTADDSNPTNCVKGVVDSTDTDGDVYRYDIDTGALECVTCVVPGFDADVYAESGGSTGISSNVAVAEDGSRVYFQSPNRLVPGAPLLSKGGGSVYRINLETGDLRWIAGPGAKVGDTAAEATSMTPDGNVIVFRSDDSSLNPLGEGTDNGGKFQYYRYDDRNRSLVCVSCPPDGSAASMNLEKRMLSTFPQSGANLTPLADHGDFAFSTTEALVGADQNTTGVGQNPVSSTDLYEWRDGRLLLITDGLTNWPVSEHPVLNGVSPSGRDVFFTAPIQYTHDALDAYNRLYDARIGGGFEFPPPPKPCPLEVCQGTPKGAPEEQEPSSGNFSGVGNKQASHPTRCRKSKVRRKGRCVATKAKRTKRQHKANHDRRAQR